MGDSANLRDIFFHPFHKSTWLCCRYQSPSIIGASSVAILCKHEQFATVKRCLYLSYYHHVLCKNNYCYYCAPCGFIHADLSVVCILLWETSRKSISGLVDSAADLFGNFHGFFHGRVLHVVWIDWQGNLTYDLWYTSTVKSAWCFLNSPFSLVFYQAH